MKRFAIGLAVVLLLAAGGGVTWYAWVRQTPPPVEWSEDMGAVADSNNRFAFDMYGKLRENEKGKSVFFSPYSIHTALSMTATGARGNTRDQMLKVLHLPDDAKVLAAGDMGRYYAHPRAAFELSVANALWGQKGFPWRAEWLATQNERFGAGFNEANFRADPEGECLRINKWVEGKTRDRIKELLLRDQITQDTRMVLTNAIYFKGTWATEFDKKKTRDATFHCADDSRVQVPMMHTSAKCGYAEINGTKLVELPYRGGELSMVVILPRLPDGLPALEGQLAPELLAKWLSELKDRSELEVSLPKFKIESRYELPAHLMALGMVDAFDQFKADFTGMADGSHEPIAHVSHKAFVEVNEEGTEGAAATAVARGELSGPPSFYADHPFLFLIRDTKHGTILFMGRVEKP